MTTRFSGALRASFWLLLLSLAPALGHADVTGAGASFPAPVLAAWAERYGHDTGVTIHYRSVGLGEGIRAVTARSVAFAMSDVPLTQAELQQDDLLQYPIVAGAIVPVVTLPGLAPNSLKLTGSALADIYLGKITQWDDPALTALNPALTLPHLSIKVIHRSDGSGTSFVFTHYLSKISAEWQDRLGVGSRLKWPVGQGAEGNDGVATAVEGNSGAIGYVEYSYALAHHLATSQLRNRDGYFVMAGDGSIRAALASVAWSRASFYATLTNQAGRDAWPIVGVSFALIHKAPTDSAETNDLLAFQDWIYRQGGPIAAALHYVGFEDPALIGRIEASWSQIEAPSGHPLWPHQ